MRSRYAAFAVGDAAYLLRTWAPTTRPRQLETGPMTWTRLEVLHAVQGGPFDANGTVEFIAHYEMNGVSSTLHELSKFERLDNRWVYVGPILGRPRRR